MVTPANEQGCQERKMIDQMRDSGGVLLVNLLELLASLFPVWCYFLLSVFGTAVNTTARHCTVQV